MTANDVQMDDKLFRGGLASALRELSSLNGTIRLAFNQKSVDHIESRSSIFVGDIRNKSCLGKYQLQDPLTLGGDLSTSTPSYFLVIGLSSYPRIDFRTLRMHFPILSIFRSQGPILDHQQILCILLLSSSGKIKRSSNHDLPIYNHDLIVGKRMGSINPRGYSHVNQEICLGIFLGSLALVQNNFYLDPFLMNIQ